jgi:hypothetical protein
MLRTANLQDARFFPLGRQGGQVHAPGRRIGRDGGAIAPVHGIPADVLHERIEQLPVATERERMTWRLCRSQPHIACNDFYHRSLRAEVHVIGVLIRAVVARRAPRQSLSSRPHAPAGMRHTGAGAGHVIVSLISVECSMGKSGLQKDRNPRQCWVTPIQAFKVRLNRPESHAALRRGRSCGRSMHTARSRSAGRRRWWSNCQARSCRRSARTCRRCPDGARGLRARR